MDREHQGQRADIDKESIIDKQIHGQISYTKTIVHKKHRTHKASYTKTIMHKHHGQKPVHKQQPSQQTTEGDHGYIIHNKPHAQIKPNQTESIRVKPNQIKSDRTKSNRTKSNQTKTNK